MCLWYSYSSTIFSPHPPPPSRIFKFKKGRPGEKRDIPPWWNRKSLMNSLKSKLFWNERHFFGKAFLKWQLMKFEVRIDSQKNFHIIIIYIICTKGMNFWRNKIGSRRKLCLHLRYPRNRPRSKDLKTSSLLESWFQGRPVGRRGSDIVKRILYYQTSYSFGKLEPVSLWNSV